MQEGCYQKFQRSSSAVTQKHTIRNSLDYFFCTGWAELFLTLTSMDERLWQWLDTPAVWFMSSSFFQQLIAVKWILVRCCERVIQHLWALSVTAALDQNPAARQRCTRCRTICVLTRATSGAQNHHKHQSAGLQQCAQRFTQAGHGPTNNLKQSVHTKQINTSSKKH